MSSRGPLPQPDATQDESRVAAGTQSPDKLYLVGTVFAFVLFLHLHSFGRGLYSTAPKGICDYDPNMLVVACVHPEFQLFLCSHCEHQAAKLGFCLR